MGLLSRLFASKTKSIPIPGEDQWTIRVSFAPAWDTKFREELVFHHPLVGEPSFQPALREIDGGRLANGEGVYFNAVLVRERVNPREPNAVAVYHTDLGKVGYLSVEDATSYMPALETVARMFHRGAVCRAATQGPTPDKPYLSVHLCLFSPKNVMELLDEIQNDTE